MKGGRMKGAHVAAAVMALVLFAIPASAQASFHLMKVREIYVGEAAHPDAEYVELQMWASGQNFVQNHQLTEYDCTTATSCTPFNTTFAANVPNGQSQRTILLATADAQTQFSISADSPLPGGALDPAHGAVCWATDLPTPIDCVSWGDYDGTNHALAGTPVDPSGVPDGMALNRTIAPNCPTMLENADDTNESATDFADATPNARNNASPITETPCAPQNLGPPQIAGTPGPGNALHCSQGSWSGSAPINYAYSWLRDNVAISGATTSTYTVKAGDAGHAVKCRVTASNGGGSAMATSSPVTIKRPPHNTVPPKITGQPKVGRTLTCNKGTWTGSAPISYSYRWLRNGKVITGATGATYVAKAADAGKFLSCRVTARNSVGAGVTTTAAVKVTA
jgi:hypothetical protein